MNVTVKLIIVISAACLGYFSNDFIARTNSTVSPIQKLTLAQNAVTNNIRYLSSDITKKLAAFTQTVSEDRMFTLRLLAENDKSSPDVTGFSARYLKPMGFSVLEIADSTRTIVSSGQFIANAGTNVARKANAIGAVSVVIKDNIKGDEVITFQAKKEFQIAGIPFIAFGGYTINAAMLNRLSPFDGCKVVMRIGNELIGMNSVHSLSELKDNRMIINDIEYLATRVSVPFAGEGAAPEFIIIVEK